MSNEADVPVAEPETNGKPPHPEFPVSSFRDAAPLLRRPFTVEAVKWKVQSTWPRTNPDTGLVVPYIDARLVIDRLNTVIPDKWWARYEEAWCFLTVDGIERPDVGEGQGKALVSDSLKRAAKHFGIGVSLNAVPRIKFVKGDHLRGDKQLRLTDAGERQCQEIYGEWLRATGIGHFGEPLDHGDALGSVGDPSEEDDDDKPAAPLPAEGPEADALRVSIRETYDRIREVDRGLVKPAEYAKWANDANHDLDALRELADMLNAKLVEARKESP